MCDSSTSVNQRSQSTQKPSNSSIQPIRSARRNSATGVGGVPARTSSCETKTSRRENSWYIVGKKLISRATRPSPRVASTNVAAMTGPWRSAAKPSVSNDDPDCSKASRGQSTPSAQ